MADTRKERLEEQFDRLENPESKDAIMARYRLLRNNDFNLFDYRDRGVSEGRKLEFYPADESDNPKPGMMSVAVFDPNLKGEDYQSMVAADLLHGLGKSDPAMISLRDRMMQGMTPEQGTMNRTAFDRHQRESPEDTRNYDDWMEQSRLDQFLGAGFLPESDPNRDDWFQVLTDTQKNILKQIVSYMETGEPPIPHRATNGGSIPLEKILPEKVR